MDADCNGTIDSETAWVYSEGHALLQFRDTDGVGSAQNLRLSNRYLYADIVDMLLADEQFLTNNGPLLSATSASGTAGTTLWPLTDHLGSVRDVVDNGKIVRQHVNYDAFGNRISEVYRNSGGTVVGAGTPGSIQMLFGFTGRDWDTDSELQYNRARWFDPKTGRWLSQDPISFAAGDTNLYRYVGNSSMSYVDADGLERTFFGNIPTGKGHHLIPVELWELFGFAEDLFKDLDSGMNLMKTPNGHNYTKHGSVTGYTAFVREDLSKQLQCFAESHGIKDGKLNLGLQRMFLQQYTDRLRTGPVDDFIRGYLNNAAKGPEAINKWWNETGRHIPVPAHPKGRSFFKIEGIGKMAGKFLGVWTAVATYNNMRADGVGVPQAATAAGLEYCNPIPIGPQEFYETQKSWMEFNDRIRNRNKSWRERLFDIPKGGDIPSSANGAVPQEW